MFVYPLPVIHHELRQERTNSFVFYFSPLTSLKIFTLVGNGTLNAGFYQKKMPFKALGMCTRDAMQSQPIHFSPVCLSLQLQLRSDPAQLLWAEPCLCLLPHQSKALPHIHKCLVGNDSWCDLRSLAFGTALLSSSPFGFCSTSSGSKLPTWSLLGPAGSALCADLSVLQIKLLQIKEEKEHW